MRVDVCGLAVDAVTTEAVLDAVEGAVEAARAGASARPLAVFSANVDMIVRAARQASFAADMAAADVVLPDGVPVLWMARGLGLRLPERVAGVDLVSALAARAARRAWSIFFLGARPGVAGRAAERLARVSPGLRVAGTLAPPAGFEGDPHERERAARAVRDSAAEVVLVALGAPRQERWILSERERTGAAALVAVGGAFDLLAGERRRAPDALQRVGLEWAWRMAQEPRRLGRRYLVDDAAIVPLYARALWRRYLARER